MSAEQPGIVRTLAIIKTNFSIGLLYLPILYNPQYRGLITAHRVVVKQNAQLVIVLPGNTYDEVPGEKVYHVNLTPSLPNPTAEQVSAAFGLVATEFGKMLVRNVTLDSYEQLYDYCDTTAQLAALQAQPWYLFARLVRHALTHDQHWRFSKRDLAKLPVTWNGRTIEAEMDGKDIMREFYGYFETIELLDEMNAFAQTLNV